MEEFTDVCMAILREKQLKNWQRAWKNELVEKENPDWADVSRDWDHAGWFDVDHPPEGYYQQHLKEVWGGPCDLGSRPG